jgi:tetratricopeptide (TPR) repeat protein/transcriptional regulator with XRE-family HTH domain
MGGAVADTIGPGRAPATTLSPVGSTTDLAGELRRLLREAEARGERSISRAGLAKRIGVSQSSLYAYLNGTTLIPVDALSALLRALGADQSRAQRLRQTRERLGEREAPPEPVLPLDVPSFTARVEHMAQLDQLRGQSRKTSTPVIAVISGTGGIGKTTLAVRWAHQRLARFPDGCLYLDLRGFHPESPLDPGEALAALLRRLGVPGTALPIGLEERRERYQQMLAGKRMLVLLDNAFCADQVRPLLPPGTSSCFVLITSRDRLSGLVVGHGTQPVPVDALSDDDAAALLAARLGADRVNAEPEAVAKLLVACAGLPLALSIVAARAQTNPSLTLEALAADLRDAGSRLDALDEGDPATSVGAVLSWSLAALTDEQARLFALLGTAPGTDIGLPAAASLIGLPPAEAKSMLHELERVSLVARDTAGRYRMHDLVRQFGADTARRHLAPEATEAALCRLIDFYTHTAYDADHVLDPHRPPADLNPPVPGVHLDPPGAELAAMAWFDAEQANLLAAQRIAAAQHWHPAVWHVARALSTYHRRRGRHDSRLAVWQAALDAAEQLPDPAYRTQAHRFVGRMLTDLGRHEEAVRHLERALALAEQQEDLLQQANTHGMFTAVAGLAGDVGKALDHAARSRELYQKLNNPIGQAHAHNNLGVWLARQGDHELAREHCQAALALYREHHSPHSEASILDTLGYIDLCTGRYADAVRHCRQAVDLYHGLGDTSYDAADILDQLGQAHVALDQLEQARAAWQEGLELYRRQGRAEDAARAQRQLQELDHQEAVGADR